MTEFEAAFGCHELPSLFCFLAPPTNSIRLRNLFSVASAHSNTRLSRIATCLCCPSHSAEGPVRPPYSKRPLVAGPSSFVSQATPSVHAAAAAIACSIKESLRARHTISPTSNHRRQQPLFADATAQPLPPRPPLASEPSFMPEPEPEAEATLQATANLSPVSPSPVHTAAPLVVPALQHTVDTIDAMVAAAASLPNGVADVPIVDPSLAPSGETDDVVDDDSFSDAYGEETEEMAVEPPQQELVDNNDDYAKTFDSPIGPEEGEDQEPQDVSSVPRESNENSSFSSELLTSHPSDVSHIAADSSASAPAAQNPSLSSLSIAQPEAGPEPASAAVLQLSDAQAASIPSAAQPTLPGAGPSRQGSENSSSVDIQQLVADLTAHPAEPSPGNHDPSSASAATADAPAASNPLPPTITTSALPSSSSLPPRPPLPQVAPQSYASQHHPPGTNSNVSGSVGVPPTPGQPSTFAIAGAPGTSTEALGSLPPPPATAMNPSAAAASINPSSYPSNQPGYPVDRAQDSEYQHQWDQFMADERQYMSEAKWDRFPEGSRIFIGNLSSDKVSKRDVFDIFHRFGRLAQISLKSAYGFVQYHTVEEGRSALENLQGMEVKGRRIHLEISRLQDKSKKERNRSPERGARGRDGGRRGEKYRDENRPARNQSPRRNDYYGRTDRADRADRTERTERTDSYGRDRGYYDSGRGRGRSRSPSGYGRNEKDSYRRRSPSPYSRPRHEAELDLPRRYGADVPDVQIIMQPDVNRDFGTWVEGAFKAKGLRTNVMYLHPRFPKDQVIQRQAAEGVHGVVDLDLRAQSMARIPVHSFDRSGGIHNVRFEQYVDLEPSTAAEVILRAKASGAASYGQPYGGGAGGYPTQYGAQAPQAPHVAAYPGMQQPGSYPQQPAPSAPAAADLASLIGQVDNNTLQRLLSTIQAGSSGVMPGGLAHGGAKPAAPAANAAVDIQAILGSLNGGAAPQQHPGAHPQMQYGAPYGGQPAAVPSVGVAQPAAGTGDAATQVQNIMAQLARYRQ
ncbi:hypothetical protein TARUN_3044 [Trichoderma arundinaceum]|uniref:RRM domain-containing protein n=1 Tax=Trichoderma arundinaceum TaxID=490622 RepID=A0A395NT72_TRIAR|nr:hypothetical protein TARUN_3044 [Trichoderma arundinaceum]